MGLTKRILGSDSFRTLGAVCADEYWPSIYQALFDVFIGYTARPREVDYGRSVRNRSLEVDFGIEYSNSSMV